MVSVCVELEYIPEEVGVAVVVTLDGVVVFVKTVSGKIPDCTCLFSGHTNVPLRSNI